MSDKWQEPIIDIEVVANGTETVAVERRAETALSEPPAPRDCNTALRHGLLMVSHWLNLHGFQCNCVEQSSMSVSVELRGYLFDVKIWNLKKSQIAYVSSRPGYVYDPEKINAKVTHLKDVLDDCQYVVHVIGSKESTVPPVFIPILKDLKEDPGVYMAKNVLGALDVLARELVKQGKTHIKDTLNNNRILDFGAFAEEISKVPEPPALPWENS